MVEIITSAPPHLDRDCGTAAPPPVRSFPAYRFGVSKGPRGAFGKQTVMIELPDRAELDASENTEIVKDHSVDRDRSEIVSFLVRASDVTRIAIRPLLIDAKIGKRRYAHSPLAVIVHRGRTTIVDVEAATEQGGLRKAAVRAAGIVLGLDVITIGTDYLHTSSFLSTVAQIASNAKVPIFDDDVSEIEELMARNHLARRPTTCGMAIHVLGGDQKARRKMHAFIARGYLQLGTGERLHHGGLLTAGPMLGY